MSADPSGESSGFQSTHWSLVSLARADDPRVRQQALDDLLHTYYPVLRAHLVLRMRIDEHRADDLLQGFVYHKILARDLMTRADRTKGRLRSLLLKSLENFVRTELVRNRRTAGLPSLDDEEIQDVTPVMYPAADAFEVAWARSILTEAISRMWNECQRTGREQIWAVLEARVLAPALDRRAAGYEELIARFGFASPQEASNALMTAKRQFKRALEGVIADSVESREEIAAELADLREILARAPANDCSDLLQAASPASQVSLGDTIVALAAAADDSHASFLARLIDVQASRESLWEDTDLRALLTHLLSTPLAASLPEIANKVGPAAGAASFAQLVVDPAPDLEVLKAVKRAARRVLGDPAGGIPSEVASALYFGSIALALVRLNELITKSGDDVIRHGLEIMSCQTWMVDDLRGLFRQALARLAKNAEPN